MKNRKFKTKVILTCLLALLAHNLQAKIVIDERKLEPALVEVLYKRIKVTDTLLVDTDFKTDYLTLMAGKNSSAFYQANLKTHDSISNRNFDYVMATFKDKDAFKRTSEYEVEVLFKNFPKGKVTNHTRHSLISWIYEEEWEKPVWEITDSTSTIGGYECMLAVSNYRGRRWYAWFTPEIAISEGPWKLCGLPGLILEAHDEKNHYQYSAMTIKLNPNRDVEYFNYSDRWKTDRITSLKARRKYLQENAKNMILAAGTYGLDPKKIKPDKEDKSKPRPHKNYDFEETDYPHEPKFSWEE